MCRKISVLILISISLTLQVYCQNKTPIAILDLEGKGVSQTDANSITDRIRHELFQTGRFRVLEREVMEDILSEQGFQLAGCTSSECAVEAGRILGVEKMVAGSVNKLGRLYTLFLRMIDVESGEIIASSSIDCECEIEEVAVKSTKEAIQLLLFDDYQGGKEEGASPDLDRQEAILASEKSRRAKAEKKFGIGICRNGIISEFNYNPCETYFGDVGGEFSKISGMELIGLYKISNYFDLKMSFFSQTFEYKIDGFSPSWGNVYVLIPYKYIGIRPAIMANIYSYQTFSLYTELGISAFWLMRDYVTYNLNYGFQEVSLAEVGPYGSISVGTGLNYRSAIGRFQIGIRYHFDTDSHEETISVPNYPSWKIEKDVFREILLIETSYIYEF